jgi:hypothetical protein
VNNAGKLNTVKLTECLLFFGRINSGDPNLVLYLCGIKHRDGVAISDADDVAGQHLGTSWAKGHDQRQHKSKNLHPITLCCPTLPIVLENLIDDFWVFQMPFANHETYQTHSPRTDVSTPASSRDHIHPVGSDYAYSRKWSGRARPNRKTSWTWLFW